MNEKTCYSCGHRDVNECSIGKTDFKTHRLSSTMKCVTTGCDHWKPPIGKRKNAVEFPLIRINRTGEVVKKSCENCNRRQMKYGSEKCVIDNNYHSIEYARLIYMDIDTCKGDVYENWEPVSWLTRPRTLFSRIFVFIFGGNSKQYEEVASNE